MDYNLNLKKGTVFSETGRMMTVYIFGNKFIPLEPTEDEKISGVSEPNDFIAHMTANDYRFFKYSVLRLDIESCRLPLFLSAQINSN